MARFLQVMIAGMVLADANCMPTRGLLRGGGRAVWRVADAGYTKRACM
jgi:hypothetical protein